MQRNEAIEKINQAIVTKYGREKLTRICEAEGWQVPEISRALRPNETATIPKKLLQFAGLEMVKEPDYREKKTKTKPAKKAAK